MENAVDALKMAFAVMVFVTAVTLIFVFSSQAKSTADYVFYYNDKTNFYDYADSKGDNRNVTVSHVISTLHRYYKESLAVTVNIRI